MRAQNIEYEMADKVDLVRSKYCSKIIFGETSVLLIAPVKARLKAVSTVLNFYIIVSTL